ncbi:hypothetical protein PSTT_07625 [Puccinia striiformis]|uniref:Uncharacterized protein n=1 Tax=Puccinia striiformis TaxID=27350 RepID=A0A2S4VFR7_9BASI|nr:hypothetical protein PSTT_07625 [Puccinia striiformis]
MNLLSLFLPSLIFQVIVGIDQTSRTLNRFKSRSIHSSKEAPEWNEGGGGGGNPELPPPQCC